MAVVLTQTDTAADSGTAAGCSGETLNANATSREATEGGTQGSAETTFDISSASTEAVLMFQTDVSSDEPNTDTWEAGDYVVRLNVTTTANNLTWVATYICERQSGGTFSTVASLTGQSTDITTTGIHSQTVNRASDYTPAGTDSTLYIVVVVQNTHSHASRTVGITPDQNIDTPITVSGGQTVSRTLSDSISFSDNLDRGYDGGRSVSDAIPFSDQIDRNYEGDRSLSDVVAFSDSLSRGLSLDRTPQDAVAFTENLLRNLGMGRDATDSLPFSENLTRTVETDAAETISRDLLDSLSFTENQTRGLDAGRILQDNTTLSENLTRTIAAPSKSVVTAFVNRHYVYKKKPS